MRIKKGTWKDHWGRIKCLFCGDSVKEGDHYMLWRGIGEYYNSLGAHHGCAEHYKSEYHKHLRRTKPICSIPELIL